MICVQVPIVFLVSGSITLLSYWRYREVMALGRLKSLCTQLSHHAKLMLSPVPLSVRWLLKRRKDTNHQHNWFNWNECTKLQIIVICQYLELFLTPVSMQHHLLALLFTDHWLSPRRTLSLLLQFHYNFSFLIATQIISQSFATTHFFPWKPHLCLGDVYNLQLKKLTFN